MRDEFRSAFRSAFGHEPDPWAFSAYAQVQLLANARQNSSATDLVHALRGIDMWTVAGRIVYNLPSSNTPPFWRVGMYQYRGASDGTFFELGDATVDAEP